MAQLTTTVSDVGGRFVSIDGKAVVIFALYVAKLQLSSALIYSVRHWCAVYSVRCAVCGMLISVCNDKSIKLGV